MIKWYDLSLIYLISGVILVLVNRVFKIFPPKTHRDFIVLIVTAITITAGWWLLAAPYLGFELTWLQFKHFCIAALIQYPMNQLLFLPYLRGE